MQIPRQPVPGLVHHFVVRFVNEQWFISEAEQRARYLTLFERALGTSDWLCVAYALMSNHLHLALLAGVTPAERWLRRVHPPWVRWMNQRLGRLGSMFAARPQMWAVRPEHVGRLIAYIHNNPVRGGVVARAHQSTWTSHGAYLGLDQRPWLRVDVGRQLVGIDAARFDDWVHSTVAMDMTEPALGGIHREARKRGAIELGTPVIGEQLEVPLIARRFTYVRPDPRRVIDIVCEVLGHRRELLRSRRHPDAVEARAVAIQVARGMGLSISTMAAALGVQPASGSRLGLRPLSSDARDAVRFIAQRLEREHTEM